MNSYETRQQDRRRYARGGTGEKPQQRRHKRLCLCGLNGIDCVLVLFIDAVEWQQFAFDDTPCRLYRQLFIQICLYIQYVPHHKQGKQAAAAVLTEEALCRGKVLQSRGVGEVKRGEVGDTWLTVIKNVLMGFLWLWFRVYIERVHECMNEWIHIYENEFLILSTRISSAEVWY